MAEDVLTELPTEATSVPLRITWDPVFNDLASAVSFGMVVDEWQCDRLEATEANVDYLVDCNGVVVGFEAVPLSAYAPDDDDDEIWAGPRFAVPALGLDGASIGEIMLAAEARWGSEASKDVVTFHAAIAAKEDKGDLEEAAQLWAELIEMGDLKGIFGLGYTLYDLGRFREAYSHLRHYTELTPTNSWSWCWLGKVCDALDQRQEAIAAYRCAIAAERAGSFETDAPQLLRALGEDVEDLPQTRKRGLPGHGLPREPAGLRQSTLDEPMDLIYAYFATLGHTLRDIESRGLEERVFNTVHLTGHGVLMHLLMVATDAIQSDPTKRRVKRTTDVPRLAEAMDPVAIRDAWVFATYALAVSLAREARQAGDDATARRFQTLVDTIAGVWPLAHDAVGVIADSVDRFPPNVNSGLLLSLRMLEYFLGDEARRLGIFWTGDPDGQRDLAIVWESGADTLRHVVARDGYSN